MTSLLRRLAEGERPEQLLDDLLSSLVDAGASGAAVHVVAHDLLLPRSRAGATGDHGRALGLDEGAAARALVEDTTVRTEEVTTLPLPSGAGTLTVVGDVDGDLETAAALAGVLLEAASADERDRGRHRRLASTFRKAARIGAGGDVRPALQSLLDDVVSLLGAPRVVVLEHVGDGWVPAAGSGVSIDVLRADLLPDLGVPLGHEPSVVPAGAPAPPAGDLVGGVPLVVSPAWLHGALVGAVVAGWDPDTFPGDDEIVVLSAFGDLVGLGLGGGRSTVDLDADLHQTREDFLSTLSHELRTPLAVIKGSVETIRTHGTKLEPDVQARLIERISHRVDQEVELIDTLLSLSRLDRGQLRLLREPFDLVEVVRSVATHHGEVTGRRIEVDGPLEAPTIADRDAVRQVLGHLVRNAIAFSSGPVALGVVRTRAGWRVEVDDDGEGIPPALRERIFERFVSTGSTGKRTGGVGVGLAVVRGLVELHGGEVGVGTSPAGGARFWFVLPDPVDV